MSYRESVRHRTDYGAAAQYAAACQPTPGREVFERAITRLHNSHPDWSRVRVRQRALVEMFTDGAGGTAA